MALEWWLGRASEVAAVAALLVTITGFSLGNRRLKRLEKQNAAGGDAIKKLERIRRISNGDDESIWSRQPDYGKMDYHRLLDRSIPILLLANLKGGVGKTTIAANLAAHFARTGERVLLIDFDYQGTLSALMLGHAGVTDAKTLDQDQGRAAELLSGDQDGRWLLDIAKPVDNKDYSKLHYVAADYRLADLETRLLIRWLLGESKGDVRYNLATVLLDKQVQDKFDRVIIDTAPRLTLALVAAVCSSTHILIPTILNEGSSRSVNDTLKQIEFLRRRIAGHSEILGIVGSKTYRGSDKEFTERERRSIDALRKDTHNFLKRDDLVLESCKIRDATAIAEAAGHGLVESQEVAKMFEELASIVAKRAPLRRPQ
jgi:cellulose biosynthesis protein BcsQ